MSTLKQIESSEEFKKLVSENVSDEGLKVVHFKSEWSGACKEMSSLLSDMREEFSSLKTDFYELSAENLSEISLQNSITAVPTVLIYHKGKEVERVDGLRGGKIASFIKNFSSNSSGVNDMSIPAPLSIAKEVPSKEPLEERLKKLVNRNSIMIFMKGNPAAPRCGFSNTLMGIMKETGLPFDTFDILGDEEVRQGLKTFSNWQTYPQIYAKGELVGGLDIIKELQESGELLATLKGEI